MHPIRAAHPRTHLSTEYPPPRIMIFQEVQEKPLSSVCP